MGERAKECNVRLIEEVMIIYKTSQAAPTFSDIFFLLITNAIVKRKNKTMNTLPIKTKG